MNITERKSITDTCFLKFNIVRGMERHKRNSSEWQFLLISEIRENVKIPCCSAGKKRRVEDGSLIGPGALIPDSSLLLSQNHGPKCRF